MSDGYEDLSKEALIDVLRRRDRQAHYGLLWERKRIGQDKALNRDFVGLELDPELSCGDAPWSNLLIEGDNYDALRNLASTMAGQFKLIYIDPPYNTGRRDFVYNDRFFEATDRFRHSTWLEFMYQRLTLAKDLLSDDGVLFVSIDDNELFNLGLLLNQVFGERSFIANCIWQKRYSRENRECIGDAHEYLLVYAPNPDAFKLRRGRIPLSDEQARVYRNPSNPRETDPTKRWRGIPMTAQGFRPNQMYPITAPNGTVHTPPEGRCWSMIEPEFRRLEAASRIYWGANGTAQPSVIRFLSEVEGLVPWTWWPNEEVGHTDEARKEIQSMFRTQTAFDTPKPTRLLRRVLEIGAPEKDALVLDFFAGSGTLGHAVLQMNKEDGGNRRFVLVSSKESTEENPERNLAREVCAKRVRMAIEGYESRDGDAVAGLGGSFGYFRSIRVPMHRLEDNLSDALVWSYAQQLAGHPLSQHQRDISTSLSEGTLLVYCTNTKPATLSKLGAALTEHSGPAAVFTWAPAVVSQFLEDRKRFATVVSVPDDLKRTFRQGRATEVELSSDEGLLPEEPVVEAAP